MDFPQENYLKVGPYLDISQGVRTALKVNEGIIKVVGAEGVGKTSLCNQLIVELETENQDVIYFETPPQSADELFQHIQSVLGLDKKKDFNRALTRYLLETSNNHKLVIIYNDAEQITKDLFILIRLLNNIHDDSKTLVSQIITGTDELDRMFDDPVLRSLTQYLNQSFTLSPMSREQLDDFYSAYTKEKKVTDKSMGNKELTELYLLSKGLPGKTNEVLNEFFTVKEIVVEPEQAPTLQEMSDIQSEPKTDSDSISLEITEQENENAPQDEPDTALSLPIESPEEPTAGKQSAVQESPNTIDTHESFLSGLEFIPQEAEPPIVTEANVREVDEILEDDAGTIRKSGPAYFKVAVSATVVIVTLVLAFVLSGKNETVPNKIADILKLDTPLYMDEITADAEISDPIPNIAEPVTVPENEIQITELQVELESIISEAVNSETLSSIEENTVQENTIAALDMPIQNPPVDSPIENTDISLNISEIELENETEAVNALEEQITSTLRRWISAWQSGDFENYLTAYHENFMPSFLNSYDLWLVQRRDRIQGAQGISISYDRLEVIEFFDNEVVIRFWLQYAKGSYADDTLKEVRLVLEQDRWLIQAERNIEVINQSIQ